MSRRPVLVYGSLALILLLAALLRLGWPGVNSFAFDEARLSLISLDMARGGQFARLGMPSSVGAPNLPAAAWVYSLPYALSPDPLVATQFTGVLSLLAVAGTWGLARRAWGAGAATVAALLLAASPYAVLYSRSIWAQDLLPVVGLAWAGTAFLGAAQDRRWAIGAHVFLAGFAFQVHFAGAALILPTAYFFVRFRWWRHWLPVLIGGGLALLTLLPFAAEVLCCRPDILDQYRSALGGTAQIDLLGWAQLGRLALGLDWGYLLLGDLQPPDLGWVAAIVAGLLLVGLVMLIALLRRARRTPEPRREATVLAEIVLAWLVASPLFFMRHGTPVWVHYHLAALPALALLAGAGTQLLMVLRGGLTGEEGLAISHLTPQPPLRNREGEQSGAERLLKSPLQSREEIRGAVKEFAENSLRTRGLLAGLPPFSMREKGLRDEGKTRHMIFGLTILYPPFLTVLAVLVALAWSVQLTRGFAQAGQVETPNGLGTPLSVTRRAAASVPDDLPVLFFGHGDDPVVDGEAAVFAALWWGRDYRLVSGDALLILPPYPAELMATLRPIQAWEEIDAAGLAQAAQPIPRRNGAEPFMTTVYDGVTDPAGFTWLDAPVLLADGTQLEGWKVRRVGPRLRISTLWRVRELPASSTIQQFHHLRMAETLDSPQPLDISDVPLSAHRWQVGDRLIVMGDFFVDEAGPFWVEVGHYTLPDLQRSLRVDGSDGLIRLGPFESTTTR